MICTVCHAGMKRVDYGARWGDAHVFWSEARLRFIKRHQAHNPRWAHSWKNAVSGTILSMAKYGEREKSEALRELYVQVFGEGPNPRVKA